MKKIFLLLLLSICTGSMRADFLMPDQVAQSIKNGQFVDSSRIIEAIMICERYENGMLSPWLKLRIAITVASMQHAQFCTAEEIKSAIEQETSELKESCAQCQEFLPLFEAALAQCVKAE